MIYKSDKYADFLHLHIENLERGEAGGIKIGIPRVDEYLEPLKKGDLGFILGRPGGMKTALLLTLTMNAVEIYKYDPKHYAPPIYVTKETAIEDLSLKVLSHYCGIDTRLIRDRKIPDWNYLHKNIDDMIEDMPIVYIGHSLYDDVKQKHLDYNTVESEIREVHDDYGNSSILIAADYLQRFYLPGYTDQSNMLSVIVDKSKDFANEEKTTWVWGCQAGRQVDERAFPIPLSGDGQWTSNIEQSGDWIVSGMRPCKVAGWKVGNVVPKSQDNIIITKELYALMVLKQRNGDTNEMFWLSFDPRIIQISDRISI